jgi:HSP20 family molecular chaperone IbpA
MSGALYPSRRLPVRQRRIAGWLDRLRGRAPQTDGVVRDDDGICFHVHVALPGFDEDEIAVAIASDHVVIDAGGVGPRRARRSAPCEDPVHLVLPFAEMVDCQRANASLRSGVLSIRAPRSPG